MISTMCVRALFFLFSFIMLCINSTQALAKDPDYIGDWGINSFTNSSDHILYYMYKFDDNSDARLELQMFTPLCSSKNVLLEINYRSKCVPDSNKPSFYKGKIIFDNGMFHNINYMIFCKKDIVHITFSANDTLNF